MSNTSRPSWPLWRISLTGLIIIALTVSAILSWHYLTGGAMAGCGSGSACSSVLGSRWSALAGIFPVSGLALCLYSAMLAAVFHLGARTEASVRRMAWATLLLLSGAALGSAVWFTIIQRNFIGAFCPYCTTAHTTGIVIAILSLWQSFHQTSIHNIFDKKKKNISGENKPLLSRRQITAAMGTGLALAGAMAFFQTKLMPSAVYQDGMMRESYTIIDYKESPIIGSPDAPNIITVLFDYNCPHCQQIHFMLSEAVRRTGGQLAFVLCPVPLNRECNPYVLDDVEAFRNSCDLTKTGLAVWFADRDAFGKFDDWMFSFDSSNRWTPRGTDEARAKAIELIGEEAFINAMMDTQVEQYLQKSISIYGQTIQEGRGGIPKMIYGSRWITPEPYNTDELISIIQKNLLVSLQ